MWCCTGDNYTKMDNNDNDDDNDDYKIERGLKKGVDNNFNFDSTEQDHLGTEHQSEVDHSETRHQLPNGSNTIYPVTLKTNSKHSSLDNLPRDILNKVAAYLEIRDLMCLESVNITLREFVVQYWRTYCEKRGIVSDPTPLCVGWPLNAQSLYSYDNAVMFCQDQVKKWRIAALRSFLLETFCCVICGQHLKDRMSVDGIYFNHDVLLCFPDCYRIFSVNINDPMVCIPSYYNNSNKFLQFGACTAASSPRGMGQRSNFRLQNLSEFNGVFLDLSITLIG